MKKLSVILLLFALTAPFTGTYLYFQYNQKKIRREIAAIIFAGPDKKELIGLKFTLSETETILTWKHSREFIYNGQMYDIVDQRQEGDSVFYTCYKDDKETRLNAEKKRVIAKALGQDPTRKSQTEKLTNFFKTVFSQDTFAWNLNPPQPSIIHFSSFTFHYSFFTHSPPSPPPRCV